MLYSALDIRPNQLGMKGAANEGHDKSALRHQCGF